MSDIVNPESGWDETFFCQIRVIGHLGQEWTDWFGDVTVTPEEGGYTLLAGSLTDQAALLGLLKRVRDVGLPLVSIICRRTSRTYLKDHGLGKP